MKKICVVIDRNVHSISREYTYLVEDSIYENLKLGSCVQVTFGRSHIIAFVTRLSSNSNSDKLKEIISVVEYDVMSDYQIDLYKKLYKKLLVSNLDLFNLFINKKVKKMLREYADLDANLIKKQLAYEISDESLITTSKQQEVLDVVKSGIIGRTDLGEKVSLSIVDTLVKKGCLSKKYIDYTYKIPYEHVIKKELELTYEQQKVFDSIYKTDKINLIHGVTGSGKTEIYLKAIKRHLDKNEQVLFLVPEITLVADFANRLKNIYGENIAYINSSITDEQMFNYYMKIKSNCIKVVIGTRSAIFMPFQNLGLVIVDEEHDVSYTSNNRVPYKIEDIIESINTRIILGSATPDIKNYTKALRGDYNLVELKTRYNKIDLPRIEVQNIKSHETIFSANTLFEIKRELDLNKKVVILYNKRGYASSIECSDCLNTYKCPNCNIGLAYYDSTRSVNCSYCNYKSTNIKCDICNCIEVNNIGIGIEKVHEYLSIMFDEDILLLDSVRAKKKRYLKKVVDKLASDEPLILLGTQIVSKGLNINNVDLVVIPNVDNAIFFNDFKAQERLFQLLVQTSGRAGRISGDGRVIIQTKYPTYKLFASVQDNNYLEFYHNEMNARKLNRVMPYYNMSQILVMHENKYVATSYLNRVREYLIEKNLIVSDVIIPYAEINYKKYKRVITIKYKREDLRALLKPVYADSISEGIEIKIDLNIDHELT